MGTVLNALPLHTPKLVSNACYWTSSCRSQTKVTCNAHPPMAWSDVGQRLAKGAAALASVALIAGVSRQRSRCQLALPFGDP